MSQAWLTFQLAYIGSFRTRSRRAVDGERISHTQLGAWLMYGPLGTDGMRSRRQPAKSGTRTSSPTWISGSGRIHHPPGPPSPNWNGGTRLPPVAEAATPCAAPGRGEVISSPP